MKLISVQSRGDRLVRVLKVRPYVYDLIGKIIGYSEHAGVTIRAVVFDYELTKKQALKAAEKWLEGASEYDRHIAL